MQVSNPISQINHVRIGDTLARRTETGDVRVLGVVLACTTNSRGRDVVLLDRCSKITDGCGGYSDRLTQIAFSNLAIRRVIR